MPSNTIISGLIAAIFAVFPLGAAVVKEAANFADPSLWDIQAPEGMTSRFRPDGLLEVNWPKSDKALVWEAKLKQPCALDAAAVRLSVKLFAKTPGDKNKLFVIVKDGNGATFTYTLPQLERWALNWRNLDTYPFDANEVGRMHPQVGKSDRPGSPLPVKPLSLIGIRLETGPGDGGSWLFDQINSDSYTLGAKTNHWGLSLPLERYWMTTSLIKSEVEPYIPLDWLDFGNNAYCLNWELVAGTQGRAIKSGTMRVNFADGDCRKREQKISLGELPAGLYTVVCSMTPESTDQATPANWQILRWRAEGPVSWPANGAGGRSLRAQKTSGETQGYVGWRQTVQFAAPGSGIFEVTARGEGTAWLVPLGRDNASVGPSATIKFNTKDVRQTQQIKVTLPPETAQAYIYLMATQTGSVIDFDHVQFVMDGKNMISNGDAGQGNVLKQIKLSLNVIASTSTAKALEKFAGSVAPGCTLDIPLPDWHNRAGKASWEITDSKGKILLAGDKLDGGAVNWVAPLVPGPCRFTARLADGKIELDRKELELGVKGIIPTQSTARRGDGNILTEADLFGPGKNYFTWAMYENHPEDTDYLMRAAAWVADGRKAGFEYFRVRADWDKIERVPGVYDFTLVDQVIDQVIKQGGKVILELRCEAPAWLDYESQLDSYGRADIWRAGKIGRMPSIWSPGMLEHIRDFAETAAKRYCDNPGIAAYHLWGLPGSLDWTNLDRPWLGIQVDYSNAALQKFHELYGKEVPGIPRSSNDFSGPDLSLAWRRWVEFRRLGLENYMIDYMVKPLRNIDPERCIIGYYGLDFASPRLASSARDLRWRRHTGGCGLIYQTQIGAMRALSDIGKPYPQEVHLMTPTAAELEQATSQISVVGGQGLNWNYYWRDTIRTGAWTSERNEGLAAWQSLWRPLWQELRDAELTQAPTVAVLNSWSTMQYLHRSFFPLRQDDLVTRLAASLYRDGIWPAWFSENAPPDILSKRKLLIVPASGAQVIPQATADMIARFVQNGGKVLMFPDSGRYVVEEAQNEFALLKRLGWQGPLPQIAKSEETEDGNSGFARLAADNKTLTFDKNSLLAKLGTLKVNNPCAIAKVGPEVQVEGRFTDGAPAVLRWRYGKGEVLFVAGQPEWQQTPGFLGLVADNAGCARQVSASKPYLLINDLTKGKDRYLIVHRLPDSYRPHTPELTAAVLDKFPAEDLTWYLKGLDGKYTLTEVSLPDRPRRTVTGAELAAGIAVNMKMCQTRVFQLTPAK